MKRLVALLVFVVMMLGTEAKAEDRAFLFKDFAYGATKNEVNKIIKTGNCGLSADGFEVLCVHDYEFLGNKWRLNFAFDNDKLSIVYLTGGQGKNLLSMIEGLGKSFAITSIQCNAGVLDVVKVFKENNGAAATDIITKFEQSAIHNGRITYILLEKSVVAPLVAKVKNMTELASVAPDTIREVDVEVVGQQMNIRFFTPLKAAKDAMKSVPVVEEKF